MDAVVGPVVRALLQDHRQEEERDGVVVGELEAGTREPSLIVVGRGFHRVVNHLLPGRRLVCDANLVEDGPIDQHAPVLEVVLFGHPKELPVVPVSSIGGWIKAIGEAL